MSISKDAVHSSIFYYAILLAALTFPFSYFLSLPIAILLLINWIAEWNWKEKKERIQPTLFSAILILCLGFFLLYVIGILYSQNKADALSSLEYKVWFLVAPMVFLTLNPSWLPSKRINTIMVVFLCSCLAMICMNLFLSFKDVMAGAPKYIFFYTWLSHNMHPSYSALHVCTAFLFSFYFLFISRPHPSKKIRVCLICALILFMIYVYLLQSKTGLITMVLIGICSIIYQINRKKSRVLLSLAFLGIIVLCTFTIYRIAAPPVNRIQRSVEMIKSDRKNNKDLKDGTLLRLAIWDISFSVFLEELPFGVGTGDVESHLMEQYKKAGFSYLLEKKSNCHNQYLQTGIGLGIPGLLVLLSLLALSSYYAVKRKDIVLICFILTIALNLLTESMLERKAGSDFIALTLCFLLYRVNLIKDGDISEDTSTHRLPGQG